MIYVHNSRSESGNSCDGRGWEGLAALGLRRAALLSGTSLCLHLSLSRQPCGSQPFGLLGLGSARSAKYSAIAFEPSRACFSFRMKSASARLLVSSFVNSATPSFAREWMVLLDDQ